MHETKDGLSTGKIIMDGKVRKGECNSDLDWQSHQSWLFTSSLKGDDISSSTFFLHNIVFSRTFRFLVSIFMILFLLAGLYTKPVLGESLIRDLEASEDSSQSLIIHQNTFYAGALGAAVLQQQKYRASGHFIWNIYRKLPARIQKYLLPTLVTVTGVTYTVWQKLSHDLASGGSWSGGTLNMQLEGDKDLIFNETPESINDSANTDRNPQDEEPAMMGAPLKKQEHHHEKEYLLTDRQIEREQEQEAKNLVLKAINKHSDASLFFQIEDHEAIISDFVKMTNQNIQKALAQVYDPTSKSFLEPEQISRWGRRLVYHFVNNQANSAAEIYVFMADILKLGSYIPEKIAEHFVVRPQELNFIRSQILKNIKNLISIRPIHKWLLSAKEDNLAEIEEKILDLSSRDLRNLLEPLTLKHTPLNFSHTEWSLIQPRYIIDFLNAKKIHGKNRATFFRRIGGGQDNRMGAFFDLLGEIREYLYEQNIFFPNVLGAYKDVNIPASSEAAYEELILLLYSDVNDHLNPIIQKASVDHIHMASFSMMPQMYPKIKALYLSQVLGLGGMSSYQFSDTFDMDPIEVMSLTKDIGNIFLKFSHIKDADFSRNSQLIEVLSQSQVVQVKIQSPHTLIRRFNEMTPQHVLGHLVSRVLEGNHQLLKVESFMSKRDYHNLINLTKENSLSFRIFLSIFMNLDQATLSYIAMLHKLPEETVQKTYDNMNKKIKTHLLSSLRHNTAESNIKKKSFLSTNELRDLYKDSMLPEVESRLKYWFSSKSEMLWQPSMIGGLYSFTERFLVDPVHWDIFLINILHYGSFQPSAVYARNQISNTEYNMMQKQLENELLRLLDAQAEDPLVLSSQNQQEMKNQIQTLITNYKRLNLTNSRVAMILDFTQLSLEFELSYSKLRLFEKHFLKDKSIYWLVYLQIFDQRNSLIKSLLAHWHPSVIAHSTKLVKRALQLVFDSHNAVVYLNTLMNILEHLSKQITIDDLLSLPELTQYSNQFNGNELYAQLKKQIYVRSESQQKDNIVLTSDYMSPESDMEEVIELQNYLNELKKQPLALHILLSLILNLDQTSEERIASIYHLSHSQVIHRKQEILSKIAKDILEDDNPVILNKTKPKKDHVSLAKASEKKDHSRVNDTSKDDSPVTPNKTKPKKEPISSTKVSKKKDQPLYNWLLSAKESNLAEIEKRFLSLSSKDIKNLLEPLMLNHISFNFSPEEWSLIQPRYIIDFLNTKKIYKKNRAIVFKRIGGQMDNRREVFFALLGALRRYLYEKNILSANVLSSHKNDTPRADLKKISLITKILLIKKSKKLKEVTTLNLPYLTEEGYEPFEEQVLTTPFEKHVFISYLLDSNNLKPKYFINQYNLENSYKFYRLTNLLKYKIFYFFHLGQMPLEEEIERAENEYRFFQSYYEQRLHQSVNHKRRQVSWSSSAPSKIVDLYESYTLAEMVILMKKSKKLQEIIAAELPYLNEENYEIFEEQVLTTSFEKDLFIGYLLGINKSTYKYFIMKYNLDHHDRFYRLTDLLKHRIFYFFHSGQIPEPSKGFQILQHTVITNELSPLKEYYRQATSDHEDTSSLQQGLRQVSWLSTPSEITDLYESHSLAEIVFLIKQSKRLKKFVAVGLPYLNEEGYGRFEEQVLTTSFEKHVFIMYLLTEEKISYTLFVDQYNLKTHTKFFKLLDLLKYKFFYFFHSGQAYSPEDFPSYNTELRFVKSYYEQNQNKVTLP